MRRPGGAPAAGELRGTGLAESRRGGGLRLALRMARRMAAASLGRSVLIAVLIAVPVMGVAGIDTVIASRHTTPADVVKQKLGDAQALLQIVTGPDRALEQDPLSGNFTEYSDNPTAPELTSPASVLPAGTRIIPIRSGSVTAKTATGIASIPTVIGASWDPVFSGSRDVVSGHRPTATDEIMVSPAALARFGIQVGGTITTLSPKAATFTVTGTMKSAEAVDSAVVLYGEAGSLDALSGAEAEQVSTFYLPDRAISWTQVQTLNKKGITVLSREVLLDPPVGADLSTVDTSTSGDPILLLFVALLGAFGLFEVCLLAGAAFAVGASRRQRALALFASVGADRRTIFTMMTAEGVLLGLIGGLVGTGLGVAAAAITEPLIASGLQTTFPRFQVDLVHLAVIVVAATLAGWAAAAAPARRASRVDVSQALRGAQRPTPAGVKRPLLGVFVAAAGSVVTLAGGLVVLAAQSHFDNENRIWTAGVVLLVVGPVTMQVGFLLITKLLLRWAARLLSRLGSGARLGGRDASRNSSRTVPAVAAIMSCVFISAFSLCMLSGGQAQTIDTYTWSGPRNMVLVPLNGYDETTQESRLVSPVGVPEALDRAFPTGAARVLSGSPDFASLGTSVTSYTVPRLQGKAGDSEYFLQSSMGSGHLMVGTDDDLATILGGPVSSTSKATLAAGGAVSLYPQYVRGGEVTFDTVSSAGSETGEPGKALASVSIPATVQKPENPIGFGTFVSTATAKRLGIRAAPLVVVSQLPEAPTVAETDAATALVSDVDPSLYPNVEMGPSQFAGTWSWALLAATTLIAVVSSAVALALSRADARRDDQVLSAIGAPPRLQRAFGFWQGIVVAGLGSVIGVALGLVPAAALTIGTPGAPALMPFAPPWPILVLVAVGIPVLVGCGSWLAMRRPRGLWTVRRLPAV